MEEKIDRYSLLEKALDRLSIIHDTDKAITTGKNKLCFTLNGEQFELIKSSDKVTGNRKTILEGVENTMKPVILYQDDEDRFNYKDVDRLTISLDRYFIIEKLGMPERFAVCNSYYYTKPLLERLGIDLFYLFGCAKEESQAWAKGIILFFITEDKESFYIFIIKNTCIEIMKVSMKRKKTNISNNARSLDGESYELRYEGSTPDTLKTSVEMLITELQDLRPASGKISYYGDL